MALHPNTFRIPAFSQQWVFNSADAVDANWAAEVFGISNTLMVDLPAGVFKQNTRYDLPSGAVAVRITRNSAGPAVLGTLSFLLGLL